MKSFTPLELAAMVDGDYRGSLDKRITGIASLREAQSRAGTGDIAFFSQARHKRALQGTQAAVVLIREEDVSFSPTDVIVVSDPYQAYVTLSHLFICKLKAPTSGIHSTAIIGRDCQIDPTVSIGPYCVIEDSVCIGADSIVMPYCFIGEGTTIGNTTRLCPRVTIHHHCRVGSRVVIQSGAVIGGDGFGFLQDKTTKRWERIPQLANVLIDDDVEIGANTTIDRGALENTHIAARVKLDNQIQVAHGVEIGADTIVAACVGIAGSVRIGARCLIAGHVGIADHIEIGNDVFITGMTGVGRHLREAGVYTSSTAVQSHRVWLKNALAFQSLHEMKTDIETLKKAFLASGEPL